ncbi:methylammonium permease 3 [Polychaeton citri CBS 116435]|uniref:Ammonium transporter n=1 Tax=Polychaeton citri CBS 116435 TaxID=1314669 RepID=A0A9P4QB19_9PEZI|nr:methylammonium permease 3 [Polychaeton citri CBS 116435]
MSTNPAPAYNSSQPWGGDSLTMNVNAQYAGYEYNYIYLIICAFLVWLIIPGIGLLYGGLARRKSSLSLLFQCIMVAAVTTFQWMFWGYSLAYSRTAGPFIGNLDNFGMKNVAAAPQGVLPEIAFCLYQMLFAACTVQILIGGAFERGRIIPSLVFGFCWATIVYCPIADWTWNSNGWLYNLPSLDYAGGGPVHIASGWAALAYALVLGKRKHRGEHHNRPHNTTLVFLGTVLIWFGWFGFNGGSALNGSVRAMYAAFNTNTAAGMGAIGWVVVDYVRTKGKFSVVGACLGAIAGLVGITPAAGYVSCWLAAVIGFLTAVVCALLQNLNDWIGIDEGLEVFRLHGVGGMVGSFLTGIFADRAISLLDGVTDAPGAINGNGIQIGYQLAEICAISAYSFVVSCILLLILKYIPFMHLRVDDEIEERGLDTHQFIDEQIGDWEIFELGGSRVITHGAPSQTPHLSSQSSTERQTEVPDNKE